jgi:hypothetical protein
MQKGKLVVVWQNVFSLVVHGSNLELGLFIYLLNA